MEQAEKIMPTHIIAGAGVVLNEGGEVLLVRTPRSGWVFPGGQVEVGENVIDAVRREILEETGVTAEVGEIFCISSNTQTHPGHSGVKVVPTKLMLDFICRAVGGTPRPSEENPSFSPSRCSTTSSGPCSRTTSPIKRKSAISKPSSHGKGTSV